MKNVPFDMESGDNSLVNSVVKSTSYRQVPSIKLTRHAMRTADFDATSDS